MKHLEVHQKYSGAHHIFNSLLSVSSGDETLPLMPDVLQDNHQGIHHFHIDHNAPCLLYPPKFCITIVLDFSWEDCYTQDKLETIIMQNFGG